jgi:hypothetical protein
MVLAALKMPVADPRADFREIVKNLIHRMEPIIALQHDGSRRMACKHVIKELEHRIGDRLRMGIGEKREL